ncbi:uncharacterized protein LOC130993992 [Salvia miltiorrhiza]|uniref:uncharacterized protein LOC130993992 n=1 Tax=Salvia miltiorrhiza TaxID=226208 RepID=UPI0025AB8ADC|nr:uncharacterized protein LOC130993992 [Salvia miltiorrhiza]
MYSQLELERVVHYRSYVYRDREAAYLRLTQDFFNDNPTYGPTFFRGRFLMQKELFLRIVDAVQDEDSYFQISHDARGRDSLTPLQKCTVAIRQLATGVSADTFNEYLKVADTMGRLCLKRFCRAVIRAYGAEYLHGFPALILEASPLFSGVLDETSASLIFETNRHYYQMGYYLCGDIYPEWRCFVKSTPMSTNPNEARFKKMQKSAQKDVERAFAVLQAMGNHSKSGAELRNDDAGHGSSSSDSTESARATPLYFEEYVQIDALLRYRQIHAQLQQAT